MVRKRPRSFCQKSAGGRLHLGTHTPLTQRSRSGLTMSLSRQSVGTYLDTSSDATCQGTIGHSRLSHYAPGTKSGISVRELICTKKKKKKNGQARNEWSNILPQSSQARIKPPPLPPHHHHHQNPGSNQLAQRKSDQKLTTCENRHDKALRVLANIHSKNSAKKGRNRFNAPNCSLQPVSHCLALRSLQTQTVRY